jgi:iron complex transport system ATP-binding protein
MILHATHITARRGGRTVLKEVSLSLQGGDVTALVGAPGSGKTTLMEICAGLRRPTQGSLWVAGQQQTAWRTPAADVRRAYLAEYEPCLLEVATIDAVAQGALDGATPWRVALQRAQAALETVGCSHLTTRHMVHLSAGEQLRVRLARLVVQMWNVRPDGNSLVFLDAPGNGTDYTTAGLIFAVAHALAKRGAAVLVASHDLNGVMQHADRVLMLRDGCMTAEGRADQVLTASRLAIVLGVDASVDVIGSALHPVVISRPAAAALQLPF